MYYIVYILEDQSDKTWYTGFTTNLKKRFLKHIHGEVESTRKKQKLKLIYCELYLNKKDALGRERFLKSGAGKKFIRKQLTNYFKGEQKNK